MQAEGGVWHSANGLVMVPLALLLLRGLVEAVRVLTFAVLQVLSEEVNALALLVLVLALALLVKRQRRVRVLVEVAVQALVLHSVVFVYFQQVRVHLH